MKKSRLALYIGLPLFWMMIVLLNAALSYPYGLNTFMGIFNFVPFFIILFIGEWFRIHQIELGFGVVDILVGGLVIIGPHVVFWLPVAHCINKLWERHERKSKKELGL